MRRTYRLKVPHIVPGFEFQYGGKRGTRTLLLMNLPGRKRQDVGLATLRHRL